ncbi:MAG: hypothetical protein FWG46_01350, partial [Treponema sp.]|nr:hypothetical protein [Treponema sp.]
MGEKVTVAPPVITVDFPVQIASYVKGIVHFQGTVEAFRELGRVEVTIFDPDQDPHLPLSPLLPWTSEGIVFDDAGKKNGTWSYSLDTLEMEFPGGTKLKDGTLKIQFRVFDTGEISTETIELVYFLKNRASYIRMSFPRFAPPLMSEASTGLQLSGQISDRKGLKPGYPQIKIWPALSPEPADDDPAAGYASLFLVNIANPDVPPDVNDKDAQGLYMDRTAASEPLRVADFVFNLDQFIIVPHPNDPNLPPQIQYMLPRQSMTPGEYFFRIKTSDTFYNENGLPLTAEEYAQRRETASPWEDWDDVTGFFPGFSDEETTRQGDPVHMYLQRNVEVPHISLDNSDVSDPDAFKNPHIYLTEGTEHKTRRQSGDDFRLRVLATYSEGVDRAVLKYSHINAPGGGGTLLWTSDEPEYPGSNNRIFTYIAPAGNAIFEHSPYPYTLEVTAYSDSAGAYNPIPARYSVYIDGEGPIVRIQSVIGAIAAIDAVPGDSDGESIDDPYTVSGNIQVIVTRNDSSSIMEHSLELDNMGAPPPEAAYPMVKWIVEDAAPGLSGSMLEKIENYRSDPSYDNLRFFYDIDDDPGGMSGWVRREENIHTFRFNTFKDDGSGGNAWDNPDDPASPPGSPQPLNSQYLWVYVIAQDMVHNLGYIIQKIRVNDSLDTPVIGVPNMSHLNGAGDPISGADGLHVIIGRDSPSDRPVIQGGNWGDTGSRNVLGVGDGIDLIFTDYDGIRRREMILDGDNSIALDGDGRPITGIAITLTDLVNNVAKKLSDAQLEAALPRGNAREWSGTLTPAIMAEALFDPPPEALPDGFYKIEIRVADDVEAKVRIDGTRPGDVPAAVLQPPADEPPLTYYFAVSTAQPKINITAPEENSLQTAEPVAIEGTVESLIEMQRLYIAFTPDIYSAAASSTAGDPVEVALVPAVPPRVNGVYYYTWKLEDVTFNRDYPGFSPPNDMRRFSLEAFDRLGVRFLEERTVMVDTVPPEVNLNEFNNNRAETVHGKIHFVISAFDNNGLRLFPHDPGNPDAAKTHAGVWWWILPADHGVPEWEDFPKMNDVPSQGMGRQFLASDENSGRFRVVADTRDLPEGRYKLWAAAMDNAGLITVKNVLPPSEAGSPHSGFFTVDQSRDYPEFDLLFQNPINSRRSGSVRRAEGLVIGGKVSDDDRFDSGKVRQLPYAAENRKYDPLRPEENSYVLIRFPKSRDYNGTSKGDESDWGDWINVTGRLDPVGDINYEFRFNDYAIRDVDTNEIVVHGIHSEIFGGYFNTDGVKFYQIKVMDEPAERGGSYGKNPDGVTSGPLYIGVKEKIFPADDNGYVVDDVTDPDSGSRLYSYRFILDDTDPQITFSAYDGTDERPTYASLAALLADLGAGGGGTVTEANLDYLSFTYGGQSGNLVPVPTGQDNEFRWSLTESDLAEFETALQGAQTLTLEARDIAGNVTRVPWLFYKDTKGPRIITASISRAIRHGSIPAAADFPDGSASGTRQGQAWPSDWPNGTTQIDGSTVHYWRDGDGTLPGWDAAWTAVIKDWPTEYAFFADPEDVREKLQEDLSQAGYPESLIVSNNRIRGSFQDDPYSRVREETGDTFFWYRFNKAGGREAGFDISTVSETAVVNGWIPRAVEAAGPHLSSAVWEIPIDSYYTNPAYNSHNQDGPNTVDIIMKDSAGNWSELYGMAFVLDRYDPYFVAGSDNIHE